MGGRQGPTLYGVWGGTTARQRQLARTVKVLDPWLAEDGPGLELVGAYLADRCVVDPDRTTLRVDLYRAF